MKITAVLLIASPFLAVCLGVWAFDKHISVDWASYGYTVFGLSLGIDGLAHLFSAKHGWVNRLRPVGDIFDILATVLILATVTQAIAVNPADWLNICLKNAGFTLVPAAVVAWIILAAIIEPLTPNSMRSGRKVPLTPFLERK